MNYSIRNVLGYVLPWQWYVGEYKNNLILNTECILQLPVSIDLATKTSKNKTSLDQVYSIHWSRMSAKSSFDLYSPWGQEFIGKYHHNILDLWTYEPKYIDQEKKKQHPTSKQKKLLHHYMLQCKLYFPGIWAHSYTQLNMSFTQNASALIENKILLVRYPHVIARIAKEFTIGLRYGFPIAYLDTQIIGWPKRIATHFFYNYAYRLDGNEGASPHLRGTSNNLVLSFTVDGYSIWIKKNIGLEFSAKYYINSKFPIFEICLHTIK